MVGLKVGIESTDIRKKQKINIWKIYSDHKGLPGYAFLKITKSGVYTFPKQK